MAKNIVFVLHGIGQYQDGWMNLESSAVPMLKTASKLYPFFEGKSLDTYVEFVPVLYDDVFDRVLKYWSDLGKGLQSAIPVMPQFAGKAIDLIAKADDDTWALKTGADAVLYWGFRLFQQRVILRVLAQLCSKIATTIVASGEAPHYHVLAHSLGTAVANDALHHLGTEAWLAAVKNAQFTDADGGQATLDRDAYVNGLAQVQDATKQQNPFSPQNFTFQSITMLSNVSALIDGGESPYHSIVRPGSAGDQGAFTTNYINVNNKYDPISIVGGFSMPSGWKLGGGYDISVDHLVGNADGVHEAAHYVRHPDVHLRLLSQYIDIYMPTADDIAQVQKFEAKYSVDALAPEVKTALKQGVNGDTGPLAEVVKRLRELAGVTVGEGK